MTIGFSARQEVMRELRTAFQSKKQIYFFKHEDLDYKDLVVTIDNKTIDLSKYEIISFKNDNDLIRKGLGALYNRFTKESGSYFLKETKYRISSQGQEIRNSSLPMVELVVGSINPETDWLFPTREDCYLISHFPYRCNATSRRKFFECNIEGKFLRVDSNGFVHAILPVRSEQDNYFIDLIAKEIFEVLVYVMRISELKNHMKPLSIYIVLRNFGNKKILFFNLNQHFIIREPEFSFANQPETDFAFNFNPKEGWKGLGQLFVNILTEISCEVGCYENDEETVKRRILNLLYHHLETIHIEYRGAIIIPRVNVDLFELNKASQASDDKH